MRLFIQVSEILYDINNLIKHYVVRLLPLLIVECARLPSGTILALVGAFSVIVKTDCETDGALHSTRWRYDEARCGHCAVPRAGSRSTGAGEQRGPGDRNQ